MTRRSTRFGAGPTAAATALLLALAACSGDPDDGSTDQGESPSSGKDVPAVATVTTVDGVSGQLEQEKQVRVKAAVNDIVDQWFDGAFLGDFPRSDFSPAFVGFTEGAQANAMGDLDLMSNQAISEQIESAAAVNRRIRLELLAPEGRPRGATARFVLDFRTTGELEEPRRVTGSLYLTKQLGEWHVFGYDVLEAVSR